MGYRNRRVVNYSTHCSVISVLEICSIETDIFQRKKIGQEWLRHMCWPRGIPGVHSLNEYSSKSSHVSNYDPIPVNKSRGTHVYKFMQLYLFYIFLHVKRYSPSWLSFYTFFVLFGFKKLTFSVLNFERKFQQCVCVYICVVQYSIDH